MNLLRTILFAAAALIFAAHALADDRLDFASQPTTIKTNLAQFLVTGYTGQDDYKVQVNGLPKITSTDGGYRQLIDLNLGNNKLTAIIYDKGGKKKKTITKYIVCDPLCKLSNRELVYAVEEDGSGTVVLDPANGFQVGFLSAVDVTAATPDGRFVVDGNTGKFLPVDDPSVEYPSPFSSAGYYDVPIFSPDGHYAWLGSEKVDLWKWKSAGTIPIEVNPGSSVALKDGSVMGFVYDTEAAGRFVKLINPQSLLVKSYPVDDDFPVDAIDPTGNYVVDTYYGWGEGHLYAGGIKNGRHKTHDGLSDFMGDVVYTPDGKWAIAGSYGNVWREGDGRLYVVELATKSIKRSYYQFGAINLAISASGRTLYTSSNYTNVYWDCGDEEHRGVEIYSFNNGKLTKSSKHFYLKINEIDHAWRSGTAYDLVYKPASK